jgi:CheY-like chemotaxis protein
MSDVRVLVVEDTERWQELLKECLQGLGESLQVDIAPNYRAALQAIRDHTYDLVTMDLELSGDSPDPTDPNQEGMQLLRMLRDSHYKQNGCGLIVVTGFASLERMRQAFRTYGVDDFIDKADFDDQTFLEIARAAVRNMRLRRAVARSNARYRLTITCGQNQLVGSELSGPDRRAAYASAHPISFEVDDLVRRTDNLNTLLLQRNSADAWRPEARSIGDAIYQALAREQRILGDLVAARALADRFSDLWIQFSSPPVGLGLPFELLRDGDDFLGYAHILTRRLHQTGPTFSRKPEPFHAFVEALLKDNKTLRVLVVGANSDGAIPEAEREATEIAAAIKRDLDYLGITSEVLLLAGRNASYARVSHELSEGRYHIFHYAGHGRYSDTLPEISGLILSDEQGPITLTAADLNSLVRDTDLQLVYLSCCLGARNATQIGRGDFYGALEAVARADVPIVLGYRWTVVDKRAKNLARQFYHALWQTFSAGEALLAARKAIARGPRGRDDDTWISPVLLVQNG